MKKEFCQNVLTPHHAKYFAYDLTRRATNGLDRLSQSLFDAAVDLNPHQIEAALFALQSPLSKGVILADEVGLGKTIEAGIVMCQYWAERQRRLLVICPASLRKQWALEIQEDLLDEMLNPDEIYLENEPPLFIGQSKLRVEITTLTQLGNWARRISIDTKSLTLLKALEIGFEQMKIIGAACKAVIFTESRRTQEYLKNFLETFNWLISITVEHIAAPQAFTAEFQRDSEGRLRLKGRFKLGANGDWWFRIVSGTTPDGCKAHDIWRNRPGGVSPDGIEQDNLVNDEWFTKQGYSSKDSEFDLIYVNVTNDLENLRLPDASWKVQLIEEDFHRLMFETKEVQYARI